MTKGLVIGGKFGEVLAREKSDEQFEIGELLIAQSPQENGSNHKVLCQVYDLSFGSQISLQNRELISGMVLEEESPAQFIDQKLRQYTMATLRELLSITNDKAMLAKGLPTFFSQLRDVRAGDFSFLETPKNPLYFGKLRSGSKVLEVPVQLDGEKVLSHHVLIPATTGRGKSNFLKVLLYKQVAQDCAGMLVLDPHDEYYRPDESLRKHPCKDKVQYYSTNPVPGSHSLLIEITQLRPEHFNGVVQWSGPQKEVLSAYYKKYKKEWVSAAVLEKPLSFSYNEATLGVVKRRLANLLDLTVEGDDDDEEKTVSTSGPFRFGQGTTTISDVLGQLESAHTVIIDTSIFSGPLEILLGSIFSTELLKRYKKYKQAGTLRDKPVVSVVLEEAPRVIGKEVLEQGQNIFGTIAREGRKFKIGIIAITQLPSLIPRQILANMNTKVILGLEMRPERQAVIESASQDLSKDDRAIASLDKGEAIITTNFSPFAVPVKIPLFSDVLAEDAGKQKSAPKAFPGLKS